MSDLLKLCREIRLPDGVSGRVLSPDAPAEDGFSVLREMLLRAADCEAEYGRLGIPHKVYVDTMACFTRFVNEHKESFGRFGFDRGWWTERQVTCLLFRVGELEYALTERGGSKTFELHIPSDAALELPLLRRSRNEALELLGRAFPEYAGAPVHCRSWLLSPQLRELLPPSSRILAFQTLFDIAPLKEECRSVRLWVFKNMDIPIEHAPENTALQRNLKRFLLDGGFFTEGEGFWVN